MLSRPFFSLFFFIFLSLSLYSQTPSTEVRAVWLTTNWNIDWPSANKSVDEQKKELCSILDRLEKANFNTVFFQARIRGDVYYKSSIEEWSPFYSWDKNVDRASDPLSFAIAECHKRGLECHAWMVVFPLGTKKQVEKHRNSIVYKNPSLCKFHNGEWYLDPGNPQAQKYIQNLVEEVVANYDLDGVHFDYIRYPENAGTFPDKDTYKKYGEDLSLADWRRQNINSMVANIYDLVKKNKPWVQVSSSPLGRYKALATNDGWTAYESVFQDAAHWLKSGKHDAVYPMMYYRDANFYPYMQDWIKESGGRIVVPGLGVYRLLVNEGDWSTTDLCKQIDFTREHNVQGQAYFRTGNILNNTKGILPIMQEYYKYPAKLPAMTWLHSVPYDAPVDLEVFKTEDGLTCLRWQASDTGQDVTYTVYSSLSEAIDTNNSMGIIATGLRQNEIYINVPDCELGVYYAVTASDRFHNESQLCFSAYFVHSSIPR